LSFGHRRPDDTQFLGRFHRAHAGHRRHAAFPTAKGLAVIDPKNVGINLVPPPLVIER